MAFGSADKFDALNIAAEYAELTVGTTPIEVKFGADPLLGRKLVHMQAKDNSIWWGYNSSVSSTTGTRIFKDQFIPLAVGENIRVWVVGNAADRKLVFAELS